MVKPTLLFCLLLIPALCFPQGGLKKPTLADYLKLFEQNKQQGDIKEATRFLNEAATMVWEEKNYPDAIKYFNQSIELNTTIANEAGISKIQANLGMIYADMAQYEQSLDWCHPGFAHMTWDNAPIIRRVVRWVAAVGRVIWAAGWIWARALGLDAARNAIPPPRPIRIARAEAPIHLRARGRNVDRIGCSP